MKERIEIQDDLVRLFRSGGAGEWVKELELPLGAFMRFLEIELPRPLSRSPLLPPGCRWYGERKDNELVIIEDPPRTRVVRFSARTRKAGDEAPEETYELTFPYTIYGILFSERDFEEMKIFYRPSPLRSVQDPLFLCNLLNVQMSLGHRAQSRACLRPKPEVRDLPLPEQVERLIAHFWSTEFNLDIEDSGFAMYAQMYPELGALAGWEKRGREDPFFVLNFSWEPARMSLADLVDSFLGPQRPGGREASPSTRRLADLCYSLVDSQAHRPWFDHREGIWRQ